MNDIDLGYKAAEDIQVGDKVHVDGESREIMQLKSLGADTIKIIFAQGLSVVATRRHRFLAELAKAPVFKTA